MSEQDVHPKGTASDTLDRIRKGGAQLILSAQRRLSETRTLLDEGNFKAAMATAASLHEKISALSEAEGAMGVVAEAYIVKCGALEVGMMLADVGEITAIEPCPCDQPHCDRIVLTIGDQPVTFSTEAEVIVADRTANGG